MYVISACVLRDNNSKCKMKNAPPVGNKPTPETIKVSGNLHGETERINGGVTYRLVWRWGRVRGARNELHLDCPGRESASGIAKDPPPLDPLAIPVSCRFAVAAALPRCRCALPSDRPVAIGKTSKWASRSVTRVLEIIE